MAAFTATAVFILFSAIVLGGLLLMFPATPSQPSLRDFKVMVEKGGDGRLRVPVVSYNIRVDVEEGNKDNNFSSRAPRLAAFFHAASPWLVGLQEPSSSQLLHLENLIPDYYGTVVAYQIKTYNVQKSCVYLYPTGYEGHNHSQLQRTDSRRRNDFQTAILYDTRHLKLIEQDHIWLSETPKIPNSKGFGSRGIRTATGAVFKVINGKDVDSDGEAKKSNAKLSTNVSETMIIHINTHLDVWIERARRGQSRVLLQWVHEFVAKFPEAYVFVTGDFNTSVGQDPYQILTAKHLLSHLPSPSIDENVCERTHHGYKKKNDDSDADDGCDFAVNQIGPGDQSHYESETKGNTERIFNLKDAWEVCAETSEIPPTNFATSFHGWLGTIVNSYAARMALRVAFALHGSGVIWPKPIPTSLRQIPTMMAQFEVGRFWSQMPLSFARMHVDWILYSEPKAKAEFSLQKSAKSTRHSVETESKDGEKESEELLKIKGKGASILPIRVFMGEVRNQNFSSDHFPIVALFEIELSGAQKREN